MALVFYSQERSGWLGRPLILKLRTMCVHAKYVRSCGLSLLITASLRLAGGWAHPPRYDDLPWAATFSVQAHLNVQSVCFSSRLLLCPSLPFVLLASPGFIWLGSGPVPPMPTALRLGPQAFLRSLLFAPFQQVA